MIEAMSDARTTLIGAVAGVVLLGGAVGFAVALPEIEKDPGTAASGSVPRLPDRLGGSMVAVDTLDPADVGDGAETAGLTDYARSAQDGIKDAQTRLKKIYGAGATRLYFELDGLKGAVEAQRNQQPVQPFAAMVVTVVPGEETGIVMSDGPFTKDASDSHTELQEIEGFPCSVSWVKVDAQGQPITGDIPDSNYAISCRATNKGFAYDVSSTGLSPTQVAERLRDVAGIRA